MVWKELRRAEKWWLELRRGEARCEASLQPLYAKTQNLSFNPVKQQFFLLEVSAPRPVRVLFAAINLYLILVVSSKSCGRFFDTRHLTKNMYELDEN